MANNYPIPRKRFAFAATTEATPGTPETITWADDSIRLLDVVIPQVGYLAENTREGSVTGTLGTASAATPAGKFYSAPIRWALGSTGSAFSASNLPESDVLLRAAGLSSVTLDTTAGLESVHYRLSDDPTTTITAAFCVAGKKYVLTYAVIEGLTISMTAGSFPVCEGTLIGVASSEAESDLEAATYDAFSTARYPIMQGANSLTVGAYQPMFESLTLNYATTVQAILNGNATSGHGGYRIVSRAPVLELNAKVPAAATWDPRADVDARTTRAIDATSGTGGQYTRVDLDIDDARARIAQGTESGDYWNYTVTYEINPATDEASVRFD